MKKNLLKENIDGIKTWLKKEKPEIFTEQKHCEEGTIERIYWHYGYMMAMIDVSRNFNIKEKDERGNNIKTRTGGGKVKGKIKNWKDEFDNENGKFYRVVTTLPPSPLNGRIGIYEIKDELKFYIEQLLSKKE